MPARVYVFVRMPVLQKRVCISVCMYDYHRLCVHLYQREYVFVRMLVLQNRVCVSVCMHVYQPLCVYVCVRVRVLQSTASAKE